MPVVQQRTVTRFQKARKVMLRRYPLLFGMGRACNLQELFKVPLLALTEKEGRVPVPFLEC